MRSRTVRPARSAATHAAPTSWRTPRTGTALARRIVTSNRSRRSGAPSLNRITAAAPARSAWPILSSNGQVPRWTSAIRPAAKPSKSSASQPLLEPLFAAGGGTTTSTTATSAVTSPPAESEPWLWSVPNT